MTYGQQPYGGYPNGPQSQYTMRQQAGQTTIDATPAYAYERAEHVSITRAYGEMTIGLLITAAVAIFTQMSGFYVSFLRATGALGVWLPAIVQIGMAVYLGVRVMKMSPAAARVCFYIFAALMGVTMSTIFGAYNLGTIGFAFLISAGFYFALTMFGLTTKANMLKAGPVLMIALIVLIVAQVILMFVAPTDTMLKVISAIGIILFAGMTIYDAQFTRAAAPGGGAGGPPPPSCLPGPCARHEIACCSPSACGASPLCGAPLMSRWIVCICVSTFCSERAQSSSVCACSACLLSCRSVL